ncbi:hypothetical protein LP417_33455 (plasmid) [Polaromonas sp. P1-6]|nr:hypothetical protein LP417_33455 [Polaromonas sp. P1-6]
MRLSVDPNQAYDVKSAIRCMRRIEGFAVDLVEQPVPAADIAGLRQVRQAVGMEVEADESVTSVAALLALIRADALDSANLKVADLGGLRNTLQCAPSARRPGSATGSARPSGRG